MKIRPTQSPQQAIVSERDGGARSAEARAQTPAQPAAQVQRSAFARALENAEPASVRRDLVAEVRAQLAAGTFEDSVDLDATVNSLLADL